MKQLSIIVPVYNVEQFIRPCVESIFMQGLDEAIFEVILVNDGTKDDSFGKIADIVAAHKNVKVVEQSNQGLSAARNTGLREASGQYVLFLDSDDLLLPVALGSLLQEAEGHKADLVIADFVKMTNEEIDHHTSIPSSEVKTEVKSGSEVFLYALNPRHCYVWRTLYRKAFLDDNQLRFIPGIYFEDVPFTVECYLKAKVCVKISRTFYIYRQRENSIVSTVSMRKLKDLNEVIRRLWLMRSMMNLSASEDRKLMETLFVTFSITLWYLTHDQQLLAQRKEYVSDLRQRVPNLWFTNGLKQMVVSFCFRFFPCTYIKIRSL